MTQIKIYNATYGDVDRIYELGKKIQEFRVDDTDNCFWPKPVLENLIESQTDIVLCAKLDYKITGFSIATTNLTSRKGTIENCYVISEYHYRGIGRSLMNETLERLKKLGMTYVCSFVETQNTISQNMLKKVGFNRGKEYCWMSKEL